MATAQDQSGLSDTSLDGALAPYGGSAPLDSSPVLPASDPSPASSATASSSAPASSSGGNWWDTITSLPSTLLSGLNNLTGGNAGAATGAAAGLYEANKAKQDNAALAKPLTDVSTPLLNSGLDQLGKYQQLTPLQQSALTSATDTGKTLTGEADPLIGIGKTAMSDYTAGRLPQWQQAQLDAKIAQAKALARQSLGANVDSTTLAQIDAQIESQAMQTQGQLLSNNLATGEASYKQGTDLQQQGGADTVAGYQNAVKDVNTNLSNALSTITAGLGPLEESIKLQIAGNTALTGQLQTLFGALAKSMNTGSSASGSSGGSGGLSSTLTNGVKSIINKIFGSGSPTTAITSAFGDSGLAAAGDTAASNLISGMGADVLPSIATDVGGAVGADALGTGLTSAFGDAGLAAAGDTAASNMIAGMGADVAPSIATDGAAEAGGLAGSAWMGPAAAFAGMAYDSGLLSSLGIGADPNRTPVGNPLTGGTILEGQPGYDAVNKFQTAGAQAETTSLNMSPMDAMSLYDQYMSGGASGNPLGPLNGQSAGTSYAQLVKDYIAQGGDPSKILPQYRQYIGA